MKYAGIIKNDIAAGEGVNVTFFSQGCPFRCEGCHNPETWDFEAGKEFTPQTLNDILESLSANGIQRNLSIMGGEPLAPENVFLTVTSRRVDKLTLQKSLHLEELISYFSPVKVAHLKLCVNESVRIKTSKMKKLHLGLFQELSVFTKRKSA